jgi:hypothetical protein
VDALYEKVRGRSGGIDESGRVKLLIPDEHTGLKTELRKLLKAEW